MVKKLEGSKMGEGAGGTSSVTADPNNPSFDVAAHETKTDAKIRFLCGERVVGLLTDWERNFVMECYGKVPLSKAQHIKVARIYQKYRAANGNRQENPDSSNVSEKPNSSVQGLTK
ncbi:hypothetical protein EBZ39_00515 [bacterium]|nr:hypothetical protein [bacterium]